MRGGTTKAKAKTSKGVLQQGALFRSGLWSCVDLSRDTDQTLGQTKPRLDTMFPKWLPVAVLTLYDDIAIDPAFYWFTLGPPPQRGCTG